MEEIKKMQDTAKFFVVDDGTEVVPIYNKAGIKVGEFCFVPTDLNIVSRFDEVAESFKSITSKLENANIDSEGNGENEEDWTILKEVENELFEKVNYVLGGDFAGAFFGKINPFSPINGTFYFVNALNSLSAFLNKRFDSEVKKITSKVDSYTHGYRTGKHKNGGKKKKNGAKR